MFAMKVAMMISGKVAMKAVDPTCITLGTMNARREITWLIE